MATLQKQLSWTMKRPYKRSFLIQTALNKSRPSESKSYAYKAVSIFDFSQFFHINFVSVTFRAAEPRLVELTNLYNRLPRFHLKQ
jgi:hypothetical protein